MSTFRYKLLTSSSNIVEGEKEAENKTSLISDLRKSGHIILNIHQINKGKKFELFFKRVSKKAVLPFTQELATLLEGGIPIDKSLSILLSGQGKNAMKSVIEDLLNGIKSGKSFTEALKNHEKLFSSIYISMVRAGEEGGVLPQVLKRLGDFQEKLQKTKGEIISAMIYPLLLSSTGLLSIGALIVYVIPKFSQIFEGMGISLPFSTMVLMGMSQYGIKYSWIFIAVIMALFFIYKRAMKDNTTAAKIDQKKLKLPLMGNLLWKMQISRFARTMGTLLENGVPLLKSLDIVKDVLSNKHLSEILVGVKTNVKEGAGITVSLAERGFLPEIAIHLLKVGEETGKLDRMLLKVADNFDADVEGRMKRLVTMVEPVLILLMGAVIGVIVISMLTAILSVNDMKF
ncbi:MAG: type II secretion system F family protein [Planctomycetia bacterium]|uniref:type II secretion system F family protein n=1 Tax=Candidatus Kuenenia sp. TaxID=2499824 RepID=UPI001DFF4C4E|nr:type II secretion system F family protein [Planctomycetia bacterium]